VYSGQQTDVIESKPAVKIQSASAAPGIAPAPRSVVQVPMTDDESAGSGGVPGPVPMLSGDEEGEDDESGHDDDEEEVAEINHEKLPKVAVRAHSPCKRAHKSLVWTHLRRIDRHDVTGHGMMSDCTHVCVYPLSDDEDGVKRYCNTRLKLFRTTKTSLRIQKGHSVKFGYLPMMAVAFLGSLNDEWFCERVLSCVKLVLTYT